MSVFFGFFSVKCEDRKCQSNALCKGNKCVCANGYIENEGICEGKMLTIVGNSLNAVSFSIVFGRL